MSVLVLQIIGLAVLVLVVLHLVVSAAGWYQEVSIDDWQFAAKRFHEDHPGLTVSSGIVSQDHRAALLEINEDSRLALGIVTVLGDKWVTRVIDTDGAILASNEDGILLTIPDITFPPLNISLQGKDADYWLSLNRRIKGAS